MNIFPRSSWPRLRQARGIRLLSIVGLAVAVVVAVGVALTSAPGHGNAARAAQASNGTNSPTVGTVKAPTGSAGGISVTYPTRVPNGYGTPSGIAADSSGGVWYFAESADAYTLFHFNAQTGKTTRYQLPRSSATRAGMVTPIVVEGANDVWIGINHTLAEVNVSTRAVKLVALPTLPLASKQVIKTPAAPRGSSKTAFEDVQSLAASPDGQLYVGRLFSSELQSYDPANGSFKTYDYPSGSVLEGYGTDLAALSNGTVDAVLLSRSSGQEGTSALESHGASGWSTVATGDCVVRSVTRSAGRLLAVGSGCASGASAQASAAAPRVLPMMATGPSLGTLGSGVSLSSTEGLVGTPEGAELLRGSQATAIPLGSVVIAPSSGGAVQQGARPKQDRIAPMLLGLVSSESGGQVWFTSGYGGPQIGLITSGR